MKNLRVGLSGAGRLGSRILAENARNEMEGREALNIVAVHDPANLEIVRALMGDLANDVVHGPFPSGLTTHIEDGPEGYSTLAFGGQDSIRSLRLLHGENTMTPQELWRDEGVDLVIEATGGRTSKAAALEHVHGPHDRPFETNVRYVVVTAPMDSADVLLVPGITNCDLKNAPVPSTADNGSCTTKSALPPLKILSNAFGINFVDLETVHAATGGAMRELLKRRRTGLISPELTDMDAITSQPTGAAKAVERFFPELSNKLRARAWRVPVENGSFSVMNILLQCDPTVQEVREALSNGAKLLADRYSRRPPMRVVDKMPEPAELKSLTNDAVVPLDEVRINGNYLRLASYYSNEVAPALSAIECGLVIQDALSGKTA